jgi:DNA-binding NarL/FixJ family response regulator
LKGGGFSDKQGRESCNKNYHRTFHLIENFTMKQTARKTRLLIVDDHALVRSGIRHLLQSVEDIQVVGEAGDGIEALQMVRELAPDVIVLDMEMPVMDGAEMTRRLRSAKSPVRVLALSVYNDPQFVLKLQQLGVNGYLAKKDAPAMIVEAIRRLARGEQGLLPGDCSGQPSGQQSRRSSWHPPAEGKWPTGSLRTSELRR